jgi:hypothetical protein
MREYVRSELFRVVRNVLVRVIERGHRTDGALYFKFRKDAPGVVMPESVYRSHAAAMPEQHPYMVIVLEHEFSALDVTDVSFSVTLAFSGVPVRLTIPFAALTQFLSISTAPSVVFTVQFTPDNLNPIAEPAAPDDPTARVVAFRR